MTLTSNIEGATNRPQLVSTIIFLTALSAVALALSSGCDSAEAEPRVPLGDHGGEAPTCGEASTCGEAPSHGGDDQGSHEEIGSEVVLSASAIERAGIRVAEITSSVAVSGISGPAEVQLNPDRVAHVSPIVAGQLREVRAALGDPVESGQVLATLRSIDLGQARAADSRARALLSVTRASYERQRQLRQEGISSERALLEAQYSMREAEAERNAARARLRVYGVGGGTGPDMPLISPIDGVVVTRHATYGENVSTEEELFVVADLSRVWIVGQIYEQDIASLRAGVNATLTLRALPGRSWTGPLTYIASTLDEETRSLTVRIELDNPDGLLRPGMFGALRLDTSDENGRRALLIPDSAVQELQGRSVVFVPSDEANSFRVVEVVTGAPANDLVEVLDGLESGVRIVVEGAFILKSQMIRDELEGDD